MKDFAKELVVTLAQALAAALKKDICEAVATIAAAQSLSATGVRWVDVPGEPGKQRLPTPHELADEIVERRDALLMAWR